MLICGRAVEQTMIHPLYREYYAAIKRNEDGHFEPTYSDIQNMLSYKKAKCQNISKVWYPSSKNEVDRRS